MKSKLLLLAVVLLTGCASSVIDLGVTATTGRSIGSHILSDYHQQDCNTMRVLNGQDICRKAYYGQIYYKKSPEDLLSQY